jgi:hypothetical protein
MSSGCFLLQKTVPDYTCVERRREGCVETGDSGKGKKVVLLVTTAIAVVVTSFKTRVAISGCQEKRVFKSLSFLFYRLSLLRISKCFV